MTVYVLFHESDSGRSDYVEAVFATEADAEAAKLALTRRAIAAGLTVYYNPDTKEESTDWEHDWRVEAHPVQTGSDIEHIASTYDWPEKTK